MMSDTLWKLPVPATAVLGSPVFVALTKRQCELSFHIETDGGQTRVGLLFDGVEGYKCTYLTSCSKEMFNTAYGKLVRLGVTVWLDDVMKVYARASQAPKELQHLMICFDDGPCYEIICVGYRAF
jgi:hypothetical protein